MMDYKKVYDALMEKRRSNPVPNDEYGERHHIVPRSEGGSDDSDNLVRLTAREHYIAHLLLAKIYNDFKMYSAVTYMRCSSPDHKRDFKFNSRLYQKMREELAKRIGEINRGRKASKETKMKLSKSHKGLRNSLGYKHTDETRKRMSESHRGMKFPESRKRNIAEGRRGSRWITNGVVEIHFHGSELPIGFRYGRRKGWKWKKKKDPLK